MSGAADDKALCATATPYERWERIEQKGRAILDAHEFNGSITIHFSYGRPMKVEIRDVLRDTDDWSELA